MIRAGRRTNLPLGAALVAAVTVASVTLPETAAAQKADLEQIERKMEEERGRASALQRQAEDLGLEIQALTAESISAARAAQNQEAEITALEERLVTLQAREAELTARLAGRRQQMTGIAAALQRIALRPPETLVLAPGDAVDTARSALLLRVAIPEVEARAASLREELAALHEVRDTIEQRRDELDAATAALQTERERLRALLDRKAALRAKVAAESDALRARADKLAVEAKTLRELMQGFEAHARAAQAARAARPEAPPPAPAEEVPAAEAPSGEDLAAAPTAPEAATPTTPDSPVAGAETGPTPTQTQVALVQPDNIRPFPQERASLRLPASGRIVARYGQARDEADTSKGIVIAARPLAQVVAPFDGQVVYAGPFRSYGQILIIEHGGRYHTLLAGLDRIDAVVGQWVLAGEPVGVLGPSQNGMAELYLELRRAGQPINPLPWLATTGDKVQG